MSVSQNILKKTNLWISEISIHLSSHTITAYKSDLDHFFNFLSNHFAKTIKEEDLQSLKVVDIRSWLSYRQESFDVRSTVRAFSAVKNFFEFAKKNNFIHTSPFENMKPPKLSKLLPKPLSKEQALDIIDNIQIIEDVEWVGLRDKAFFMLIYSVGLRISESLNLNQKIIKKNHIIIHGKGNKERVVPLIEMVKKSLIQYLNICPHLKGDNHPLFFGLQGKRLNVSVAQNTLKKYAKLSNLPDFATPHAFRHACATHLVNETDDLRAVQELLGHSSLSTTQIYTKVSQEKLLKTYNKAHPRSNTKSHITESAK
ncbi:MAG: tyrosine recombinase XerC, partial [Proteobacteria bacterium]|nr:tyrosine recombinase XerC [Pseudomonadota bacterium]